MNECVTVGEFRRAVITGWTCAVIFVVIMGYQIIQTHRSVASSLDLHTIQCKLNADLLSGIIERRSIEASVTYSNAPDIILQQRRTRQFNQAVARLQKTVDAAHCVPQPPETNPSP